MTINLAWPLRSPDEMARQRASLFPLAAFFRRIDATPLVPVCLEQGAQPIWCKLEFLNPSGSIKDRVAGYILSKALRSGELRRGATVVEASSGSTSIALAMVCAQLGLRFITVMPEGVSRERTLMIRAYGGQVQFSRKEAGMLGALRQAAELAASLGAFAPRQFENPDNAAAHRFGTAVEIFKQIPEGKVDAVVSGVGTGGTLAGLVDGCRDHGCGVTPVAARPVQTRSADVRSSTNEGGGFSEAECCSFSTRIPGVVDRLSKIYRPQDLLNLVEIDVGDERALELTRRLIALGFPVGPSSGLNLAAALEFQRRFPDARSIVTVFPDRTERYFSTDLFLDRQ